MTTETDYIRDAYRYRFLRTAGAWDSEAGLNALCETPELFDIAVDERMQYDLAARRALSEGQATGRILGNVKVSPTSAAAYLKAKALCELAEASGLQGRPLPPLTDMLGWPASQVADSRIGAMLDAAYQRGKDRCAQFNEGN